MNMCNYNTEYFSALSKTGCRQNNKGPFVRVTLAQYQDVNTYSID